MNRKTIQILLVEDNPADVRLTEEALKYSKVPTHLSTVSDGTQAIDYLTGRGAYQDTPLPDIILLDLNLPKESGREVLSKIKQDQNLRRIPVIILTTSEANQDINGAYDLQANAYIRKPLDFDEYMHAIGAFVEFWLNVASLPGDIRRSA